MRAWMSVQLGMILALGAGVTHGEGRIRVHEGATVEAGAATAVGSLTLGETLPPTMVTVPAGVFTMGDGMSYCGWDQREVTLTRGFDLCRHEVTNQEYLEAVQWAYDHGYVTATTTSVRDALDGSTQVLLDLAGASEIAFSGGTFSLRDLGHGVNPGHPVKEVTWYGAARYCDWLSLQAGLPRAYDHSGDWSCNGGDPYGALGYRLPTDAEWEYAAQWDDERIYPWGNEGPDCSRANYAGCIGWTSPGGSYPEAPGTLGLSDMAGNVFEWCNDWHVCELGTSPATDPVGPASGTYRVLRGGSWTEPDSYLPCARRASQCYPYYSLDNFGFRASRTASLSSTGDPSEGATPIRVIRLFQNRPNPVTSPTRIGFELAQPGRVKLGIYGADGRQIRTLVDEERAAGFHEVVWDGRDDAGKEVTGGAYMYQLAAPGVAKCRQMIVLP